MSQRKVPAEYRPEPATKDLTKGSLRPTTRRIIRQNLVIALGVIVVLIVVTTTGMAGIGPAVVFHEGSTLVVIANALRLLRYDLPATSTTP